MAAQSDDAKHKINWDTHEFIEPKKEIKDPADIVNKWEVSEAYQDLMGFITAVIPPLKGRKMREPIPVSATAENLLQMLDTMNSWIDEIPAIEQPQRFGNAAFRDWYEKLENTKEPLLKAALPAQFHPAVKEISVYLVESVGNKTRIDYGTGHEFAFAAFLCCLFKIEALKEEDCLATILKIFQRYIELMRRLQTVYRMEPAGSHGVYSLDDYHFLPFLWGSAQLVDHARIKPSQLVEPDYYATFDKDFMFLSAVKYIAEVKTGPFAEHSNQLWNISGVGLWSKVNSGLIKMYKAEVLNKFPVIQHFLFGSLLSVKRADRIIHAPHSAQSSIHSHSTSSSSQSHSDTPRPMPDDDFPAGSNPGTMAAFAEAPHPKTFSTKPGMRPMCTDEAMLHAAQGSKGGTSKSPTPKGAPPKPRPTLGKQDFDQPTKMPPPPPPMPSNLKSPRQLPHLDNAGASPGPVPVKAAPSEGWSKPGKEPTNKPKQLHPINKGDPSKSPSPNLT